MMEFRGKYRFLSNFHPIEITFRGQRYKTSEHAYQAAKFSDPDIIEEIRECSTPGKTKRLAGKYKDRIREGWNKEKLGIMYEILCEKFKDPILRQKLIEVDEPIIEGNTWGDTFWGVCDGKGKNNLGKILERIKREIQVFEVEVD